MDDLAGTPNSLEMATLGELWNEICKRTDCGVMILSTPTKKGSDSCIFLSSHGNFLERIGLLSYAMEIQKAKNVRSALTGEIGMDDPFEGENNEGPG